jgi:hypothetical protein
MERQGSMHVNIRKAAGACLTLPLLGGALAVSAAAPPANAQTWQDTSLQAFYLAQPTTIVGAGFSGVVGSSGSTLTFTAPSGVEIAAGAMLLPTTKTGSFDAELTTDTTYQLVLSATDHGDGSETLTFTIKSAESSIACTAVETVVISEASGVLSEATPTSVPGETVTVSVYNDNATGAVQFSATTNVADCTVPAFSESNLPAGLVSGNPLVPGTAAPGTYYTLDYTGKDQLGSTFTGTFDLDVNAQQVVQPQGNYGDEVNPFGNGFDAYQQHDYPGAIIAGWTATQADPATHFIRNTGTVSGAYQFEYAPYGSASGLCVSDPGGGWASDPQPDGLILTPCNTGPWQQFIPQYDGTLEDVGTGLFVNPDGTGAQLAGGTAPTPWGGSVYTWTPYPQLPQ